MKFKPWLPIALALLWGCDDGDSTVTDVDLSDGGAQADASAFDGDASRLDEELSEDGGAAEPDAEFADDPDAGPEADPDAAGQVDEPAAPLKAYSEGVCPELVEGRNTFRSNGRDRSLLLHLPDEPTGKPIAFAWHPLGSSAAQFSAFARTASQSKAFDMIVVTPDSSGTLQSEWAYVGDPTIDLVFFDDLLACLSAQFDADRQRIYTVGFSAGALWSSYLVLNRSDYLGAAVILSGGVLSYTTPEYRIPVLLASGGPNDVFGGVVFFERLTATLMRGLRGDDHFVAFCDHRLGHRPPPGASDWAYTFLSAHTVRDGSSPFEEGLSDAFPDLCQVVD